MDILLTHGYFLHADPIEQRVMKPYVPLGILSLATYLDRHGFHAEVFDSTFRTFEEYEKALEDRRPPVVGISINLMTKMTALKMIAAARANGAWVIVGGPEPAAYAGEYLRHGADVVVIGEGEVTLTELMEEIRTRSRCFNAIPGVAFLDEKGSVVQTAPRTHIADLDSLPVPDRSKVDLTNYLDAWRSRHGFTSLSVLTMRGCPFTCTWCSHTVYGESYRRRSPAAVVAEIASLSATYHPDMFWFADDVFTINHRWLFDFEKQLAAANLKISYECITRADRMNEEVVRAMKATGCRRVWIGSESGSQRILDAMSRRVTVQQVQEAVKLARRYGIEVGMFIMLGYLGETRADIELTVRHVKQCGPDIVLTTVSYPIKGTRYYQEAAPVLQLPPLPFNEWNDRMIDVGGRYTKRFYWYANRRIVNEAAYTREFHALRPHWRRLVSSFVKAKTAQAGMMLTR